MRRRVLVRRLIRIHRLNRHLVMGLIMRLLVWSLTRRRMSMLKERWVGRMVGRLVV